MNSSPDMDGITAEHLLYCIGTIRTNILQYVSVMLSFCIQFGVVPEKFNCEMLVPIPK